MIVNILNPSYFNIFRRAESIFLSEKNDPKDCGQPPVSPWDSAVRRPQADYRRNSIEVRKPQKCEISNGVDRNSALV